MSNTEKLIKQLNENKEIRKLQEKVVKPAVYNLLYFNSFKIHFLFF